jgi:hypothetical protein
LKIVSVKNLFSFAARVLPNSIVLALLVHVSVEMGVFEYILDDPFNNQVAINRSYLPREVLTIDQLAKTEGLKDFRLGSKLKSDPLIYQRTIEFLYPIKESETSSILFEFFDAPVDESCRLFANVQKLALYEC